MKKKVIIFGSGGHSKVVCDLLEQTCLYSIYGLLDDFRAPGQIVNGYEVLGGEPCFPRLLNDIDSGIVAIGDNWVRNRMVEKIKRVNPQFNFISAVHPSSVIAGSVKIGNGTVVMAGTVINSDVIIGNHCIINTRSSIDHDCVVGNYTTIAPGVTLGGKVTIGECSTISLGSNVIHAIKIGDHTVIGAGSTVIRNIDSNVVAYGLPARVKRTRRVDEAYL